MSGRVLALTRYDAQGPSSRVRVLQYLPFLQRLGVDVEAVPLLPPGYVPDLYAGRRPDLMGIAGGYLRRLREGPGLGDFDTVWIQKEALPWLPWPIEKTWQRRARRVVVDYDDAVWLRYSEGNALVRSLLGRKIGTVMAHAHCVVAGNRWIAEYAREAGAGHVVEIPSVVNMESYRPRLEATGSPFTLGWVGSPATLHYLERLGGVLAALSRQRSFRLVCVGVERLNLPGVHVVCRPWSAATEAADICSFDAGLMPLFNGPWERGKCGYKLIQYMACGLPAVGSAVGANCDIVEHGVNGLLAKNDEEWIACLNQLMNDPALRARIGAAARERVAAHYSVQSQLARLAAVLCP